MQEDIFAAMDAVQDQGLEAMLKAVEAVAAENHDFSMVANIKIALKQEELGLTGKKAPVGYAHRESEKWKELYQYMEIFHREAAHAYFNDKRQEGHLAKAAKHFCEARQFDAAFQIYMRDGSDASVDEAIVIMTNYLDYERGILMRFERSGAGQAFMTLANTHPPMGMGVDTRKVKDALIKTIYDAVIQDVKAQIAKHEDEIPETTSLNELLEGRGYIVVNEFEDSHFGNSRNHITGSADTEVLKIGLEYLAYNRNRDPRAEANAQSYQDDEMWLRGKLGEHEKAADYFIERATAGGDLGNSMFLAGQAIELLELAGDYDVALELAQRFFPPDHYKRNELLQKCVKPEARMDELRRAGNVVGYALAKAELEASEVTN
jgi:hypothetical protein